MEEPTCYLVTLSAYGNRLHGDERGTVDNRHNRVGSAMLPPNAALEAWEQQRMRSPRMHFSAGHRKILEAAVGEICSYRGWDLLAVHCRTNHIHVVVTAGDGPDRVLHSLKTYSTRALRAAGVVGATQSVWARGGSIRPLGTEPAIRRAIDYTMNRQGDDVPGTRATATRHEVGWD